MPSAIDYHPMRPGEAAAVSALAIRVFDEFVAPDYADAGVSELHAFMAPASLQAYLEEGSLLLVATVEGQPAGVIAVRDYGHVFLLFVDKRYQRRGVARGLLGKALEICLEHRPQLVEVSVNSSPYAVPVYERLGFHATGPEQTVNGILFTPMTLALENWQR